MDTTYRPMSIGQRNIMYGRYLGNTCTHDLTIHSTWRAQIYDFLVYFSYTVCDGHLRTEKQKVRPRERGAPTRD
jgi:hypothetical protein